MTKVLRLATSILGDNSVSESLAGELLTTLEQVHGPLQIKSRDFSAQPVPHLDQDWLKALGTPADERTAEQQERVDYSDGLIEELRWADLLVIGLPMYNFTVPSMLKAWNDHVARAGVTFRYTQAGPQGLLEGKKAYLIAAMGGRHEIGQSDFARPYMKQFLGFLGITEIEFITASGLNLGDEARQAGIAEAQTRIRELLAQSAQELEEQAA